MIEHISTALARCVVRHEFGLRPAEDNRGPSVKHSSEAFAKLSKGLVRDGAFRGLSSTAFEVYLMLLTKSYEKVTPTMARRGIRARESDVSYAYLASMVSGRREGKGASRGALLKAVAQLVERGLIQLVRKGKGPGRPNRYYVRTYDEWRQWAAKKSLLDALQLEPNTRDVLDRRRPRGVVPDRSSGVNRFSR